MGGTRFDAGRARAVLDALREGVASLPAPAWFGLVLAVAIGLALWSGVAASCFVASCFAVAQRRTQASLADRHRALETEAMCVRLLQDAAIAANEADDLDEAVDRCVARVIDAPSWAIGMVWEPDGDASGGGEAPPDFVWRDRLHATRSAVPETLIQLTRHYRARPGELALGRVIARAEPQWGFGEDLDPAASPRAAALRGAGLNTAIAIPVLVNGRVERVLELFGDHASPPADHLIEVLRDVGRQLGRVAERVQLQESVRRSQKLESIGQLAAGIAHEISNPMAWVRANLTTLEEEARSLADQAKRGDGRALDVRSLEAMGEILAECQDGVDRTIGIVRDVRDFARDGRAEVERVEVADMVDSALRVAGSAAAPGLVVERDVPAGLAVFGLAGRLRQVVLNLVLNAMHAVPGGGRIRVEAARRPGETLIRVADDGHGIRPGDLEHVFEPFFTTKPAGQGTGLGLYISHEIVRWHGGAIELESRPGEGACFTVVLPDGLPGHRESAPSEPDVEAPTDDPIARGSRGSS